MKSDSRAYISLYDRKDYLSARAGNMISWAGKDLSDLSNRASFFVFFFSIDCMSVSDLNSSAAARF